MAKVFRFHNGADNIEDWQTSAAYGKNAIDAIKDPAGASAKKEITSIPSPFARIDLVKTAFENIANSKQIEGNTIFHKMVSDCFDVGEIFFNIDKLQNEVSIIVWDKSKDLDVLLQSPNARHRLLGDTLKLYLEQDAAAYNFNDTEQLYLLNYKAGPKPMNIIGGTSPASLFFTSANDLKYVNIPFGKDLVFDDTYQPLYKRDFDYQKFIYGLKRNMPNFSRKLKAVDSYLESSFELLTPQQKATINNYTKAEFESDFERLTAGSGTPVEILGFELRKKKEAAPDTSGFIIAATKSCKTALPLVLPVDAYAEKTIYTSDFWDRNNKADYTDERPLKERTLPFDGKRYPYVTISDFLEPYIVRTVYPLHSEKFFDGHFTVASGDSTKGYLLPVKKEYFDYFDSTTLQDTMPDGKQAIEIKQMATGGVNVTLRVPIQNSRYITYERVYYPPANEYQIAEPDVSRNHGAIIENQFGLTLYPFLKLAKDSDNHYRIAFMDRDIQEHTRHNKHTLQFYKNEENKQVIEKAVKQRSDKHSDNISSDFYVLEEGFDYIEIKNKWAKGILIPKFKQISQGTSQFIFAIDFGTSNTHIEYRKDNGEPKPFEITAADIQIATLHDPSNPETIKALNATRTNQLVDLIPHEFLPEIIAKGTEIHFPQRTAISSKKGIDLNDIVYALSDFNIPFLYEKHLSPRNAEVRTNLKWSDIQSNNDGIKIIEAYFENLLLLIRNKVLLNGGDLSSVKLIWLYPSSMTENRRNKMEQSWEKLFKKYFNSKYTPSKLSESVAPFYYFNKKEGIVAGENSVISIDIGGETTDVVIYINDKPEVLTSFRFAANSIFGDYIGRSSAINGFVKKYSKIIEDKGLANWFSFQDIEKSEDIISYLFSIEKSDRLKTEGKDFSFNDSLLNDNEFRIIFIIFYSSIIYHIAKLMVAKQIKAPGYITLSGTGSKMIDLAEGNTKLTAIKELTELIFKQVYKLENIKNIELKKVVNPKEISCIGALLIDDKDVSMDDITVLSGTSDDSFSLKYSDINSDTEKEATNSYLEFLDFFFALNNSFSFKKKLDINPAFLTRYKEYMEEKTLDNLKSGVKEKLKELQGISDIEIEETLFFYPLKGALNHLAFKIYSELNSTEA